MKKVYIVCLYLLIGGATFAQSSKQVNWTFSSNKISDKIYEVHLKAEIGHGFHMYAQNPGVEGPQPTRFEFVRNPLASLDGKVKENGKVIKKFESAWNASVNYFEHSVEFIQVVKLKGNIKTNLAGTVEFMVCDDSKCLPPSTVEYKVNIGG
jgi:DsbC/DsbD-like thiol-disulfide interchange protein